MKKKKLATGILILPSNHFKTRVVRPLSTMLENNLNVAEEIWAG